MTVLLRGLIFTALACINCMAAQMTVGDLMKLCTSSNGSDKASCSFYILGVTEGASLGSGTTKDKTGTFRELKDKSLCIPDGVSATSMEFVVRKSMGEDLALFPADRDLPAVSFVIAVMTKQFPCEKPH
jgi:hypothetical protein